MQELLHKSLVEVSRLLSVGEISPVELARAQLDRIDRFNDKFNCYITVMADEAMVAAKAAERELRSGRSRGPLHGIPIAVKDVFDTRGTRTTAGTRLYADRVPDHDASVIKRLHDSGAIISGKTNLHELSWSSTSINPHYGAVRNPWNPDHIAGGSSGGSAAAVAAGLAFAALGSDTGCSIRQPAHCCGIVGLKPQFGRVAKDGAIPCSLTLDHIGPMARTVDDTALLLQAIAGFDARDPYSLETPVPDFMSEIDKGVDGMRVGFLRGHFSDRCEADVASAVEAAAEQFKTLGASVKEVCLPALLMEQAITIMTDSAAVESVVYFADDLCDRWDSISDYISDDFQRASEYSAADYVGWQHQRRLIRLQVDELLRQFDVLISPTSPLAATPIDDTTQAQKGLRNRHCAPFNVSEHPAVSLPCGFTQLGMPVGLQIIGRELGEVTVLGAAAAYEQATTWHQRLPEIGLGANQIANEAYL